MVVTMSQKIVLAPYHYMWASNNKAYKAPSLCDARKKFALGSATLAFVIGGASGVNGGSGKVCAELGQSMADIHEFVKTGGTLIISFGGASGPYLEDGISDPAALFAVWDSIIQATGVTSFDFDVEGAYIENQQHNKTRIAALVLLQKRYPSMYLSYTLAVMPPDAYGNESLGAPQLTLIKNTIAAGVRINVINMMTMDYGQTSSVSMGQRAIDCAESVHRQLATLYPNTPDKTLYKMIGITPMIGVNDDQSVFTESDAALVSHYAGTKGIGLLSYWALQRDQLGKGSLAVYSNANSTDYAFYKAFSSGITQGGITQGIPQGSTPSSSPSPQTPATPVSADLKAWAPNVKYVKGAQVTYAGRTYTCVTPHTSQSDWVPSATPALWNAT